MLAQAAGAKLDDAVNEREERVVPAHADVTPRVEAGSTLAHEDVTGRHLLAAETLDSQALSIGVPAVPGGPGALLGRK